MKTQQIEITNPTIAVAITMTCLLIVISFLFLAYIQLQIKEHQDALDQYREKTDRQTSELRSQRDQLKNICEVNTLMDLRKEEWIRQNTRLKLPPELLGQRPCQVITPSKEEE